VIAAAPDFRAAGARLEIAAHTHASVAATLDRFGGSSWLDDAEVHDFEYWPLELYKLTLAPPAGEFQGMVAFITGAAGGIGSAVAREFAARGACVVATDLDAQGAAALADELGEVAISARADVLDEQGIVDAFRTAVKAFGGVDIVVSNAGAAWQGNIGSVEDEVLRKSFELNFFAHQSVAQNAVRIMRAQGTYGCLLFNTSKQAVNPGKDFGPYGLPKAATLFLVRQYALDHGKDGIRANAVNADRVRTGLLTHDMVAARSKARGVSEDTYMSGNLLGREVYANEVAEAFVYLAHAEKTTAAVITVDGGNIEAAMR
jgi:NAD(P)-dependent dehydrogenase (short-subunit alcohol dehydrogenase family)